MADYRDYQIWNAYLNESLVDTREMLSRPEDWKPHLKGLWYHPNAQEIAASDATERVKQGYIERLTAHTSALRGPEDDRQSLWPRTLREDLEGLSLHSASATNCHLLFDLGSLELQVRCRMYALVLNDLTPTKVSFLSPNATVQLYWPDSWEAVVNTPRYKYGRLPEQRVRNRLSN